MSTGGSSLPSPPTFLTTPATSGTYTQAADPVPVLIALACIFLLLASCLLFMMLCKPTALDPGRQGAREYMPHHPGSPSEPRLQLWKRLGSLRRSLHSFRRGRQCPLPGLDDQRGTMSTGGSSLPSPPTFLTTPATSGTYTQAADPVPVLIALACIFLLLASCLLFMMLCKPTALDPGRQGARECMPHHPGSPSEPRLQLWKRLGSLRRSLHSFR